MTQCQLKLLFVQCKYVYYCVIAVISLRPIQGSTRTVMDLDVKSKGTAITLFFNLNLVRKHEIAFD